MSKNFMFKLLLGLSLLAAAVLWLLTVVMPDTFGELQIGYWAIVIVAGGWGAGFILRGLFSKTNSMPAPLKKLWVFVGSGLALLAILVLIKIFAWPEDMILPIIAIVLASALILVLFATGGKRWDQGDNQNAGYKNYRQRKAEEEKKNRE